MAYNKKETLQENLILHQDYGESYNNTQQDQIHTAYFGNSTFSKFKTCRYFLDHRKKFSKRSIDVVSECSDHPRIVALTCVVMVLKEIVTDNKVKKPMVWSDGCASQFRSRFAFKLLSSYRPELLTEWNYNEAHHWKDPMDGVGGTIKMSCFVKSSQEKESFSL